MASMTKQQQPKLYPLSNLIFNMLLRYGLRSHHWPNIVHGVAILLDNISMEAEMAIICADRYGARWVMY